MEESHTFNVLSIDSQSEGHPLPKYAQLVLTKIFKLPVTRAGYCL